MYYLRTITCPEHILKTFQFPLRSRAPASYISTDEATYWCVLVVVGSRNFYTFSLGGGFGGNAL